MLVTPRWRGLAAVCTLSLLFQTISAHAEEGYLPNSSAFKNIGYQLQPVPASAPSPDGVAPVNVDEPLGVEPHAPSADEGQTVVYGAPTQVCASACCCPTCTQQKKEALRTAASSSHNDLHYLNNFSYLNDSCYDGNLLGDSLKGLGNDHLAIDFGGQYRARFHREENHRGLGLTGLTDSFLLHRTRLYLDTKVGSNIRFFGEVLDANSNYEDFNPRPIEENRWDVQNLFIDATLFDNGSQSLIARGGRQEISLGAQRYVSPLDWANTRRTFDGGRLMYSNDNWNVDGFWLAPMVHEANSFDEADEDVAFYGVYSTYKALENGSLDLYWLAFDDDTAGFYFDSLGARYNGTLGNVLFEAEGAYQFGTNADGTDHDAGFFTAGLGKAWSDCGYKPTTWIYLDWASGDDQQAAGNGHHHFQPLAHKYNGFMDLFGRRNLIDLNWLTTYQLSKKIKLLTWYHNFWLENDNDTPYNVTMSPFAPGVTPGDDHLGQEIDAILTMGLTPRSNILLGYSHFWRGNYYDTPGLPANVDANFFYTQYTLDF